MTPKQLAKQHSKPRAGESIVDAMKRSLRFAKAMFDAGHGDQLATGMAGTKLYNTDRIANVEKAMRAANEKPAMAGTARNALIRARKRYGGDLPATVGELWELLGSRPHRLWLRGFCVRSLLEPALLVPPAWSDGKLTCASSPDGSSVSDTRERFENEYEQWFVDADAKVKVSGAAQLAKQKDVMLDPALRDGLITIARYSSEHWFVVPALASKQHPAPVFSNHDDAEGFSAFVARDVRAWFSDEITQSIRAAVEREA